MKKVEQIINRIKKSNKSISFDDIIDLNLEEEEFEIVMEWEKWYAKIKKTYIGERNKNL